MKLPLSAEECPECESLNVRTVGSHLETNHITDKQERHYRYLCRECGLEWVDVDPLEEL